MHKSYWIRNLFVVIIFWSLPVKAQNTVVITYRSGLTSAGITDQHLGAPRDTSVINMTGFRDIAFRVSYEWNPGATATEITMRCSSCIDGSIAYCNEPLQEIVSTDPVTGRITSKAITWVQTLAGLTYSTWYWTVKDVPQNNIVCEFIGTGGGLNDHLTVQYRKVTP